VNRRLCTAILLCLANSSVLAQGRARTVRVGAYPNITHSQAMLGKANGFFEKALGPGVKVEWKTFNAGPAAIEALFAGAVDMTYIGPNPAIRGPRVPRNSR
jgi:NitT/TauT family transport system substrate-binding protein